MVRKEPSLILISPRLGHLSAVSFLPACILLDIHEHPFAVVGLCHFNSFRGTSPSIIFACFWVGPSWRLLMAVKEIIRTYLIDEDDRIHRFPWPRYVRILRREERAPFFARKTIRFAESVYGVENGAIVYALAHFPLIIFDASGRRDTVQQHAEHQLAVLEIESRCAEENEWQQFDLAERMATLRWEPSESVLKALEGHVPQLRQKGRFTM